MSRDYVPHSEPQFADWTEQFVTYAVSHADELRLDAADVERLTIGYETFQEAYASHRAAQRDVAAACRTKDDAKKVFTKNLRSIAQRIKATDGIGSGAQIEMGISLPTPEYVPPLAVCGEVPVALIDISKRRTHILRIWNKTSMGTERARPANSLGCEVWRQIGGDGEATSGLEYVGLVTRSPYIVEYPDKDAGKMAHYVLRWVNRKGEKSSWSQTFSATIAA